jgi:hypothetical protein
MENNPSPLRALTNSRCIEVVDRMSAEIFRKMSSQRRLEVAFGLRAMARQIMVGSVKHFHPDFTKEEVEREVARRVRDVART